MSKYDKLIQQLKEKKQQLNNEVQAYKEIGNILYGCYGMDEDLYIFSNKYIAESITTQAKDLILATNKAINKYFTSFFLTDAKLHNYLGVEIVNKFQEKNFIIYNDNDSAFLNLDVVVKSTNWNRSFFEFVEKLFEFRLNNYIQYFLETYSKKYNVPNFFTLKIDGVYDKILFHKKKQYIAFSNGKYKVVGLEIIKSNTPLFCRKNLNEIIECLFADNFNYNQLTQKIRNIKKTFKLQKIEDISETFSLNGMSSYVVDDYNEIILKKGAPTLTIAAAQYNYLYYNNNFKEKYTQLKDGDKIRVYKCVGSGNFAFKPYNYPYEFAPQIDYDAQFAHTFLRIINSILNTMGIPQINDNLLITIKK